METRDYCAPNGDRIIGTLERLYAVARISGIYQTGEPHHEGLNDVDWNSQETVLRDGAALFVDDGGRYWTFAQLIARPDDIEDDEWDAIRDELADKAARRAAARAAKAGERA